jgi:hypothetical protein
MEDDFIDDDFGELYADLQLLPTPPSHQQHDDNDNADGGGNLNNNNNDADADADANDDYIGTDSDDDDGLKIVLNDDDCPGGVSVARDDGTDNVRGEGLGNNAEECIHDQSKFVSSDGYSKNGAKGGYGSQFFRSKVVIT